MQNRKRILTAFGKQVKTALIEKGITQKQLCAKLKMKETRLSEIIYGIRPGNKYRSQISKALGIR